MARCCMVFDSCSTVKNDEYSDVYVLPLMIIERQKAGGNYVEYRDLTEINEEGVIKKLLNGSILSTSQSSPKDTLELFDRITSEYDEIFVFPGPVTITKQYESFKTILSEYDNVHIFNQNMLGKMAQWTCDDLHPLLASDNLTVEVIQKYLNDTQYQRGGVLIVPEMKYLMRGGRVKKLKGLIATILKFKILISYDNDGLTLKDHTSDVNKIPELTEKIIDYILPGFKINAVKRIWIGCSPLSDPKFNIKELEAELLKQFQVPADFKLDYAPLTSVLAAHVGPNYILIGFDLGKNFVKHETPVV